MAMTDQETCPCGGDYIAIMVDNIPVKVTCEECGSVLEEMDQAEFTNDIVEENQGERITNLNSQVQFLVDYMNDNGWLEEGCFTFPDGETIYATQELDGG